MQEYQGYLYAKLARVGTRSEGTEYFLQQFEGPDLAIRKEVMPWQNDPALHPVVAHKVTVLGELHQHTGGQDQLSYFKVLPFINNQPQTLPEHQILSALRLQDDVFWLDKTPGANAGTQRMALKLLVLWPYRSIWEGECPTTQRYDFWVEYQGNEVWRWSWNQAFAEVITPVKIEGGTPREMTETWEINPETIKSEGVYTAKALHIASGSTAEQSFRIRFTG